MSIKKLFYKLPYSFQLIIYNIYAFFLKKRRYNKQFFKLYNNFIISNRSQLNINLLREFLINAKNTKFWGYRFLKYSININSDDLLAEISKLPILTKDEVKENYLDIVNTNFLKNSTRNSTSGTTGSGMSFPQSNFMENAQWAVWWRFRSEHGINFTEWMAWFGGRTLLNIKRNKPPYWFKIYPTRQLMFSIYHLNNDTIISYLKQISENNIKWVHGYPSTINYIADLIIKNDLYHLVENISIISLGGEMLHDFQKNNILSAFKARIIQHYGLSEGVSNISLDLNNKFIVDQDFAYTEFIHKNDNIFKIIGTNYHNNAFPLIRYDTKDEIEILNNSITRIVGRSEDYITLNNGTKVGRLDHIFKELVNINSAQLYQNNNGFLTVFVVKGVNYSSKDESKLMDELNFKFSNLVNFRIKYVNQINKTKSGKFKFVISEI